MYHHTADVAAEFRRRVFGGGGEVAFIGANILFAAPGWPEAVEYDMQRALDVLARYADGAGGSVEGDALVCAALEAEGAFVRHANDSG